METADKFQHPPHGQALLQTELRSNEVKPKKKKSQTLIVLESCKQWSISLFLVKSGVEKQILKMTCAPVQKEVVLSLKCTTPQLCDF